MVVGRVGWRAGWGGSPVAGRDGGSGRVVGRVGWLAGWGGGGWSGGVDLQGKECSGVNIV